MLANVTCPSCKHKFWLPEGDMGSRQTCPNCQAAFFAGASVAEGKPPAAAAAGLQPGYAKTMIGDPSPPIKYTCPRCKTPLEAPTSEGGTKKNCPNCTQRHQVPPAPAAAPANLNKTMLAGDESAAPRPPIKYNCPNCKRPLEAPAEQGGTKINCPACSQRLQIPAAPPVASNRNKTMLAADENSSPAYASQGVYAADGMRASSPAPATPVPAASPWARALTPTNVLLGILLLLILLVVVPAVIRGGKTVDQDAVARMQLELEKLKQDFELKKMELERQNKGEAEIRKRMDDEARSRRSEEERIRREQQKRLDDIADADRRAEQKKKFEQEQQQRERERMEKDRQYKEMLEESRRNTADLKRALEESQKKQQTIIQQPPPVIHYPPYNPWYYRPSWWW